MNIFPKLGFSTNIKSNKNLFLAYRIETNPIQPFKINLIYNY
ncbi:hypothetical protein ADIARSV_3769 [Arcticibacter svalbardensis MN12-7]|uniref:Uncharacterized protein n=1 Tax=Arcticibacter svalbardensis MN12-7 TaxID=1150600 RepID=R9GNH8_9SPHI|nr:hypothetical protein ADIARSV_3769 [Arcticibacter svalbardensis MN12-7]